MFCCNATLFDRIFPYATKWIIQKTAPKEESVYLVKPNMLLKFFITILAVFGLASYSYAVDIFKVDPDHTFVSFSYSHQNYSIQTSRFDHVSGTIALDDANSSGIIDMSIDMKSVSTGSTVFNKRLQEDDFFATDRFPVATFNSEKIIFNKDVINAVQGNLTLKGITKPLLIEVTNFYCSRSLLTLRYTCGANAVAHVKRSDFDMGKYVPFVGDEITIGIAIEASKD